MRALLLLPLLLAAAADAQIPRFAGVFALPGVLCDCDPSDFVFRTTRAIPGYAHPDGAGRVVRTVDTGRLIEGNDWNEALTVTTTPAVGVAIRDLTIENAVSYGRQHSIGDADYGEEVGALTIRGGARIEVYNSVEGDTYFSYQGNTYAGTIMLDAFRWEREWPEDEVWFHLIARPGRAAAWVRIEMDREHRASNVEVLCHTHDVECRR